MGAKRAKPLDALGREIMVGDMLAQAQKRGKGVTLKFHTVTRRDGPYIWTTIHDVHPLHHPQKHVIVKYAEEELP
mgnify:CR=1 FL=1